jgi:hypothetical protein
LQHVRPGGGTGLLTGARGIEALLRRFLGGAGGDHRLLVGEQLEIGRRGVLQHGLEREVMCPVGGEKGLARLLERRVAAAEVEQQIVEGDGAGGLVAPARESGVALIGRLHGAIDRHVGQVGAARHAHLGRGGLGGRPRLPRARVVAQREFDRVEEGERIGNRNRSGARLHGRLIPELRRGRGAELVGVEGVVLADGRESGSQQDGAGRTGNRSGVGHGVH